MVDFKKMTEDYLASLSEDERQFRATLKFEQAQNTFLEGTTTLWKGDKLKDAAFTYKLHRRVFRNGNEIEIQKRIILSFGSPMEYEFNKEFVERWLDEDTLGQLTSTQVLN